ncbi:unnamed protein product [Pedinophyceae sp. YPF-701]|nr:unnamed protein product [Pedinophyceae sp. YPF-701]
MERRSAGQRTCVCAARKRVDAEVVSLGPGRYSEVAGLMVDSFYQTDDNRLLSGPARRLLTEQAADMKSRFTGRQSAVLGVRDETGLVAAAGVVATPFIDGQMRPSLADMKRASMADDLRPVVSNVVVRSDARRRGLAKALMRACEDEAREWGYDKIWLVVLEKNRGARKLYKKLGYRIESRGVEVPKYEVVSGGLNATRLNGLIMRKSLKPGLAGALENTDPLTLVLGAGLLAAGVAVSRDPALLARAMQLAAAVGV